MSPERRFSANGKPADNPSLAERHRKADQELPAKYQKLADRWAEAENYFRSLRLPQPITVHYDRFAIDDHGQFFEWSVLAFTRHMGEWRLCHATDSEGNEDGSIELRPVVDCPTDVRIRAAAFLDDLKIKAAEAKEEYIARIDKAMAQIDSTLKD